MAHAQYIQENAKFKEGDRIRFLKPKWGTKNTSEIEVFTSDPFFHVSIAGKAGVHYYVYGVEKDGTESKKKAYWSAVHQNALKPIKDVES